MLADNERQQILAEYRETSRRFADSVERLGNAQSDTEAFIRALGETGAAHRACEKVRIRLDKLLAGYGGQRNVKAASKGEELNASHSD